MAKWKIIKKKVVHSDQWSRLHIDRIVSPEGPETDYVYIARTTVGMGVVPFFEDSMSVLIVRQYRHPIGQHIWQFPGGGKEEGKTFLQTAKQELLDETGYEAGELIGLGKYYPDAGISSDEGQLFVATKLVKKFDKALADPLETIQIKTVKLTTLEMMIKSGTIRDGWTLGAYSLFKLWLEKK